MKILALVLTTLSFSQVTLARAITSQIEARVLSSAEANSERVYSEIRKIAGFLAARPTTIQVDCKVVSAQAATVSCVATDTAEDVGWTEGVEIIWNVVNAGSRSQFFQLESTRRLEH